MRKIINYAISIILTGFGLLSMFLTLSVIFDLFGIREKEGNYVLFIVYANLICGILYVIAAFYILKNNNRSYFLLFLATFILILAYGSLLVYVNQGGIHEAKTLNAMLFRISFTGILATATYWLNKKSTFNNSQKIDNKN